MLGAQAAGWLEEDGRQTCVGAQDVHTHCGLSCLVWESRIVCAVEAAPEPITGGVVVNVSGKLGHSPAHVQFTYQVGAWPFDLGVVC